MGFRLRTVLGFFQCNRGALHKIALYKSNIDVDIDTDIVK